MVTKLTIEIALIGIIMAANNGDNLPVKAKVNPTELYNNDKPKLI
jgi:hypothetical protein